MRFGAKSKRSYLLQFCFAFLVFCNCAISIACQSADERFDAKLKKCQAASEKSDFAAAIDCLKIALEQNPDRGVVYFFLAENYKKANEIEKAEEAIKTYTALYPNDALGQESYCQILEEKGETGKALEKCLRAVQIEPENARFWLSAASVQEKNGDAAYAEQSYKKTLSINPKDQGAYLFLGRLYEKNGNLDKAIETYEKLLEMKPEQAEKIEEGVKKLKERRDTEKASKDENKKAERKTNNP